ncbi:hypothetical protein RvY_04385 [Ramazzottius varieornatus]|uniref:G-protein coupled receptors family 1 profile domain-containing protein n=1 Tax=Ramazzottius varieornatus TaxID=947166 RepID=A0A1D1UV07_RAMVA|nr:hypothetical protein RvY_04385 [Ramazzottius varieornatus]
MDAINATRIDDREKASRDVQVKVLFTLFGFAIIANTAVIFSLLRSRAKSNRFSNIHFLILQLVISDLLVALLCLAADASWKFTYSWNAGNLMCKLVKYLQMFALYSSTFIVVTIAVDRCIAVRYPMHRARRRVTIRCMTVYVFRVMEAPFLSEDGQPFEQCVTFGAYEEAWQELSYILFTCCAMFVFPLVIITVSYSVIFIRIRHELGGKTGMSVPSVQITFLENMAGTTISIANSRVSSLRGAAGHRRETLMKKAKSRTLWMSILVIVNFLVCWAPYYTAVLYYVIEQATNEDFEKDATNVFQIIFFFGK